MTVQFQSPAALLGIAQDMIRKDWQPVWCPQRQSGSFSPEPGCTGGAAWMTILSQPKVAHKLAFRPPEDVLVIDVDEYEDKHGDATMEKAAAWLGDLPETYRVTSRGFANPSGRYLYRKPPDLLVTDSSLYQFGEDSKTDVEIVRTGHRFSWAPGDYHYKNNQEILCFDPMGDVCDMPCVSDLPYLPEKWVNYLRNPPVPQKHEVYTRPSDGADWWLSQADDSLGSDAELASFAYNMLLSRVPEEEIFGQWLRVSLAVDTGWPWDRKDFDRHLGSRAQYKADQILQHQDEETDWFRGTGADLEEISARTQESFDNRQSLMSAVTQPVVDYQPSIIQQGYALIGYEQDDEEEDEQQTLANQFRGLDSYQRLLFDQLARVQATKDAAKILAGRFKGYEDISTLPDPPDASLFVVTGKDNLATAVVAPRTVTVFSGHRASGKTWVCAVWAAQVIRAGGHVIWQDFERQPYGLVQKLRAVGIQGHLITKNLHYTSKLPDIDRFTGDVVKYAVSGKPVLVVVDAFRGLQNTTSPGTSANDGDAVEQVYLSYLNPLVHAGATVVLLDHLSKTGDNGTFGSERKESAADYVVTIKQEVPFTKTAPGFSSLVVSKDRYGVIAAGSPAGYLWMPGDGSKSGKSVEDFPEAPDLRNWSPAEAAELAGIEVTQKGAREVTLTTLVQEQQFKLSINKLSADAMEAYGELFPSESTTKRVIREMIIEGKLVKDAGNGKLGLPEVAEPAGATDLAAKLNPEDHEDRQE